MRVGEARAFPNQSIEMRRCNLVVGIMNLNVSHAKVIGQYENDVGRSAATLMVQWADSTIVNVSRLECTVFAPDSIGPTRFWNCHAIAAKLLI